MSPRQRSTGYACSYSDALVITLGVPDRTMDLKEGHKGPAQAWASTSTVVCLARLRSAPVGVMLVSQVPR